MAEEGHDGAEGKEEVAVEQGLEAEVEEGGGCWCEDHATAAAWEL